MHNPKSYECLIQKLVRDFIFKPLDLRPCPFFGMWSYPSGGFQNGLAMAEIPKNETQANFKDDQNFDFLDHPNGQNHIVGSQWDGLWPFSWKIMVLGVRPILNLPTSLKWATFKNLVLKMSVCYTVKLLVTDVCVLYFRNLLVAKVNLRLHQLQYNWMAFMHVKVRHGQLTNYASLADLLLSVAVAGSILWPKVTGFYVHNGFGG